MVVVSQVAAILSGVVSVRGGSGCSQSSCCNTVIGSRDLKTVMLLVASNVTMVTMVVSQVDVAIVATGVCVVIVVCSVKHMYIM